MDLVNDPCSCPDRAIAISMDIGFIGTDEVKAPNRTAVALFTNDLRLCLPRWPTCSEVSIAESYQLLMTQPGGILAQRSNLLDWPLCKLFRRPDHSTNLDDASIQSLVHQLDAV
jgi:hypothetical protein